VLLSGREVCQIMAQHGFEQVRRKGSHIIRQKAAGSTTLTVPVPDHAELKLGTLAGIIWQSGLPRSLFER
jgi:predicted RNA binding protein YcfA (HicA-like mRNA interferase family)